MDTYDEIYGRMKNVYEQETGDSFNEKSEVSESKFYEIYASPSFPI